MEDFKDNLRPEKMPEKAEENQRIRKRKRIN